MNSRFVLATVLLVCLGQARSAQDECKLPPLTRQEILAIVKKHVADLDKWEVRISEHNCSYRIDGDCCPDQRGTHWSLLISRNGKLLERFQGR
jgi:septum formation topological specificity factor MinE